MVTQPHFKKLLCVIVLAVGLCGLLGFNGCVKTDDQTAAQMKELKTELARVSELLNEAGSQRDAMAQKLETLSKSLTETQEHIQKLTRFSEEKAAIESQLAAVKTQLSEVTAQRNTAIADAKETREIIEQLRTQLQQQNQKTAELQAQIAALKEFLSPSAEEAIAAGNDEKSDEPIVGFPKVPGFKD